MIFEVEISRKSRIKKIAFSALFFNYWQLKFDQNIPAREQTSLHERKEVSLSNGAHSDAQTSNDTWATAYLVQAFSAKKKKMVDWALNPLTHGNP